jgi:hypothetical protein
LVICLGTHSAQAARLAKNTDTVCADYWRLSRIWQIAGAFATVLPLPIVYFMVTKTL